MNLEKIKSASIILAFITTLTSTAFVIDNRYVHANEFNTVKEELEETKKMNRALLDDFMKQQRIATLSDLIFDIQIKGDLTPVDRARLDRYTRELEYLQRN
jgi:hypothetical protein